MTLASLEELRPDTPPPRRPRPETRYLDPHSGLYLRWPRRNRRSWRTWLEIDWSRRGRPFLWRLHAIVGTWVLPVHLLIALTGLQWSYDGYRTALHALAGVEMPARRAPGGAERGRAATPPEVDLAAAVAALEAASASAGYSTATFLFPQSAAEPLEIRYLDRDPPHERALNTLSLDVASGRVLKSERYAEKSGGCEARGQHRRAAHGQLLRRAGERHVWARESDTAALRRDRMDAVSRPPARTSTRCIACRARRSLCIVGRALPARERSC